MYSNMNVEEWEQVDFGGTAALRISFEVPTSTALIHNEPFVIGLDIFDWQLRGVSLRDREPRRPAQASWWRHERTNGSTARSLGLSDQQQSGAAILRHRESKSSYSFIIGNM